MKISSYTRNDLDDVMIYSEAIYKLELVPNGNEVRVDSCLTVAITTEYCRIAVYGEIKRHIQTIPKIWFPSLLPVL
jgi:hypothetical protein